MPPSPTPRAALAGALLTLTPPLCLAGQDWRAPGTLAPSSANREAIAQFDAGYRQVHAWFWIAGLGQLERATELDPEFGLARALAARARQGADVMAELDRAAADAARASAVEGALVLAHREAQAQRPQNARALADAAARLAPNDPRVATERALFLTGKPRVEALRETVQRFPDYVGVRLWLAFYLTPDLQVIEPAAGEEALRVAQEALRLAPGDPGPHTAMAHVLERLGRRSEALTHLGHATRMSPTAEYAHTQLAQIALRDGKPAEARKALDGSIANNASLSFRVAYRRTQALLYLHEGKLQDAVRGMEAVAREAEAQGLKDPAGNAFGTLALVLAGARDAAGFERNLADAKRLRGPDVEQDEILGYALVGNGTAARRALTTYVEANKDRGLADWEGTVHRLTGHVLVAENKPAEAVEHLKQGGLNPYAQLGMIEAYRKMGKNKEADAERDALLARKDFGLLSTAVPIARYRATRR